MGRCTGGIGYGCYSRSGDRFGRHLAGLWACVGGWHHRLPFNRQKPDLADRTAVLLPGFLLSTRRLSVWCARLGVHARIRASHWAYLAEAGGHDPSLFSHDRVSIFPAGPVTLDNLRRDAIWLEPRQAFP